MTPNPSQVKELIERLREQAEEQYYARYAGYDRTMIAAADALTALLSEREEAVELLSLIQGDFRGVLNDWANTRITHFLNRASADAALAAEKEQPQGRRKKVIEAISDERLSQIIESMGEPQSQYAKEFLALFHECVALRASTKNAADLMASAIVISDVALNNQWVSRHETWLSQLPAPQQ